MYMCTHVYTYTYIDIEVRPFEKLVPAWGTGDEATDWSLAAVKGAKRVLAESPDLLIVVSGIQFGMRLVEIPNRPIHVTEPELRDRTIYTSHYYYGWSFTLTANDMLGDQMPYLILLSCWLCILLATDGWRGPRRCRSISVDSQSGESESARLGVNFLEETCHFHSCCQCHAPSECHVMHCRSVMYCLTPTLCARCLCMYMGAFIRSHIYMA